MMTNLLTETAEKLMANGKSPGDVRWVGVTDSRGFRNEPTWWCTWEEFAAIAAEYEYYHGFGGQEIHEHLVVVGKNWWMERHEYDGSEWWEFKTLPTLPPWRYAPSRKELES